MMCDGGRAAGESDGGHAADESDVVTNWSARPSQQNDAFLRSSFLKLVEQSARLPPEQRLIMYDACDESEVREALGMLRKRLDARRNTKPKKPDEQRFVMTPFDPKGFNFSKIRNDKERIVKLQLGAGRYDVLTNKFPLFAGHMLLVAKALVPQQMSSTHLRAIVELQRASSFCAYFNSWCASASVNHFHCHIIDEFPPVTSFPLVNGPSVMGVRCLQPQGFPGFCYVLPKSKAFPYADAIVRAMQADNQPHNLLLTPRFIYIFPKASTRPARSLMLYPETVGGPELIGSFTVYARDVYDALTLEHLEELCRINTAPLPSSVLQPLPFGANGIDDMAVTDAATTGRASHVAIAPSSTLHALPQLPPTPLGMPSLHMEDWPQDRPIARALSSNMANSFV